MKSREFRPRSCVRQLNAPLNNAHNLQHSVPLFKPRTSNAVGVSAGGHPEPLAVKDSQTGVSELET